MNQAHEVPRIELLGDERVKKLIVATVSIALFGLGGTAVANDEYVLTYSANELSTFNGVQDVHARIVKTAKQYCPTYSQIRSHADVKTCVDGVVADLVEKVDHPQLSGYHAGEEWVRIAVAAQRVGDRG